MKGRGCCLCFCYSFAPLKRLENSLIGYLQNVQGFFVFWGGFNITLIYGLQIQNFIIVCQALTHEHKDTINRGLAALISSQCGTRLPVTSFGLGTLSSLKITVPGTARGELFSRVVDGQLNCFIQINKLKGHRFIYSVASHCCRCCMLLWKQSNR